MQNKSQGSTAPKSNGSHIVEIQNLQPLVEKVIEKAKSRWPGVELQVEVELNEQLNFIVTAKPRPPVH